MPGAWAEDPSTLFSKARAAVDNGLPAALGDSAAKPNANNPMATGWACPIDMGGQRCGQMVVVRPGQRGFYCSTGIREHQFLDIDDLMSRHPEKLAVKQKPTVQQGFQKLELELPVTLIRALVDRFKDKLASTVSMVMRSLAEGRVLLTPEGDLQRMEELLGTKITNSGMLVGLIYALHQTKNQLQSQLTANESAPAGGEAVTCKFDKETSKLMETRAQANGFATVGEFVERKMAEAVSNGWF